MHAIILAGGLGTRLRSILPDVPKPMAPIQGKPFLAYLLDSLAVQGMTRITVAAGYLAEKIQAYFDSSYAGMAIDYVIETSPLGTGGAIVNAFTHLKVDQPVFVLNGDTFIQLNYRQMYQSHGQRNLLSVGLCTVSNGSRYGSVTVKDQVITAFKEKGKSASGLINAGVYLIHPDIFKPFKLPVKFSFENDFLSVHSGRLKPAAFVADAYFIDIGIPEDYFRIQADIPAFTY